MAGTKKSPYKKGGQNRSGPARSKGNQRLEQPEDVSEPPSSALHTLSLADVARNTERHRDGQRHSLRQGTKLQFVSGGILSSDLLEPLESSSPPPRAAGERDQDRGGDEPRKPQSSSPVQDGANGRVSRTPRVTGTDTEDSSSDDVVLFSGRAAVIAAPSKQRQGIDSKLGHESGPRTRHQKRKIPRTPERDTTEAWPQERTSDDQPHSKADHVQHPAVTKDAQRSKIFASPLSNLYPSADDAALEDYISNVAAYASDDEIDDLEPSQAVASKKDATPWSQSPNAPQQGAGAETGSVGSADTLDDIAHDLQTVLDGMGEESTWTGYEDSLALPEEPVQHHSSSRPTDSVVRFTYSYKEETETASEMSAGALQMSGSSVLEASSAFATNHRSRRSVKDDAVFCHPETNLQLSDTDLERNLIESWKTDRAKKKLRRKEREEARVKGLLKKRGANIAEKPQQDIDWGDIKARILTFLVSGDESLILPPMDKTRRRTIHELANAFNLRSKSAGSGERRYPVLHRTARTLHVTESLYAEVEARLARRFRTGAGGPGTDRSKTSFAAASYRDGDVVGAQAPELGSDNRGRTMLEKMGWSSGTALGATNNKGILQPVAHTVKNTRHGLG